MDSQIFNSFLPQYVRLILGYPKGVRRDLWENLSCILKSQDVMVKH